jgi:predicted permease
MRTLAQRLFRLLARALPESFRNAYGTELLTTGGDAIEGYSAPGLFRILLDLAIRIPAEHASELRRDIRYGLRVLARSPGFTSVALISLALATAIGTTAYTEMNALVLRDVPGVPNPEELVALQLPTSYPNYRRYRELNDLFSSTLAYVAPVPFGVMLAGRTERVWGHLVTPSYFSMLGIHPGMGRFGPEYDEPGQAPAAVVSDRFWRDHLGADPLIIGKALRVNGNPCTVIGIGPADFLGASPALFGADLWLPLSAGAAIAPELSGNPLERHDLKMFQVVGRLRPGITEASAAAELNAVARKLEQDYGDLNQRDKTLRTLLVPGGKILPIRKQDRPVFTEFFIVMAGLVILIAAANVANMMLARATARRKEIAVRLAIGATRGRLIRQLLTECMLIALGAGSLGFLISTWMMHAFSGIRLPYPMPISYEMHPDWRALLFTLALTVFTGFAFGLVPALQATRTDVTPALKEGGLVRLRRFRRLSFRNLLLLAQVSGSLTLLLIVGLFALGIQTTIGIQEGFNPRDLYLISLDPVRDGYSGEQAATFFENLLERVKRNSGVVSAALTDTTPVAMNGGASVHVVSTSTIQSALRYVVGRDYFETTGIPILRGRAFRRDDSHAVIVTKELVGQLWKGADPVGRRIEIAAGDVAPPAVSVPGTFDYNRGPLESGPQMFEVIGVAGDVTEDLAMKKPKPTVYFPLGRNDYARPSLRGVTLILRAAPGVDAISAVQREIAAIDSKLTPFNARSMAEQVAQFVSPLRTAAWSYYCVGIFGLILACVGLAGVTAYSVTQRRHEIGIRLALGARASDVLGLVMKESGAIVILGTVVGLAGGWAAIRLMSSLFQIGATISTSDPLFIFGATLLLAGVALIACYLPARKTTAIDPAVALRQE